MRQLRSFANSMLAGAVALSAVALPTGAGSATAQPDDFDKIRMPMQSLYRACDHSLSGDHTSPLKDDGFAISAISVGGGSVTAEVSLIQGEVNTPYNVALIQVPRPSSQPCGAGAPGVATGVLNTDARGVGGVILSSPINSGATGAWVLMTRPSPYSQIPMAYYSTDFIATFNREP